MKVSCPSCNATLTIDDKKIPSGGARIKCPTCQNVFPVRPPAASSSVPLPGAADGGGSVPLPGGTSAGASIPLPGATGGGGGNDAVPLPGGTGGAAWDESPLEQSNAIPGALTSAAPPSNVHVSPAQGQRTTQVPGYVPPDDGGGAVPLPGAWGDEAVTRIGEAPAHVAAAAAATAQHSAWDDGIPASEPVPLPGEAATGVNAAHNQWADNPADSSSADAPDASADVMDVDLSTNFGSASAAGVPLPGAAVAHGGSVPLPGSSDSVSFDISSPSTVVTQDPPEANAFDFSEPPPPAPAAPPDAGAFDFSDPPPPPPAAAPDAGGFDFSEPPPPAPAADVGGGAFDFSDAPPPPPPARAAADADNFEADLSMPIPAPVSAPSGPVDGLEMLSFIDDSAREAGAPAETASDDGSAARRFHIKRRSGKIFGPFEEAVIGKMLEDGQLLGNEEISPDGETWQPIGAEASFQAVISKLMEGPSRVASSASSIAAAPVIEESKAQKGPSMDRLKQLYEGRMAAVAVVESKEPVSIKKLVPYIAAGLAVAIFLGIGIFAGVGTRYGFFFLKKIFPSTIKADSREGGYLQAARNGFARDTFKDYRAARDQAAQALQAKEYPEARAVWAQAVYYLARKYSAAGNDVATADAELDNIVLIGEKHPEVLKANAGHALVQKDPAAALAFIDEALAHEDNQNDQELRFLRAEALLAQKQLDQAKAEYEQILKTNAKSPRALHALGLIAAAQKDTEKAAERFSAALEAEPLHVGSAIELAELSLVKRDMKAGQAEIEKALDASGREQLGPAELGKALAIKGSFMVLANATADAVPVFEEALKSDPTNAFAQAHLAHTYIQLNQPEKALPLYESASRSVPDNLDYTQGYLGALIALGKMNDAVKVVESANRVFPGNAALAYLSGRVSDALDKPKEAEDAYKRAIAADANIADAYLYLARLYIHFHRYAEAKPILEQGLEKDQHNASLHVGMGELAFFERDLSRAHAEFQRATEANPNLAEALLGLSRVAIERNEHDAALSNVEKALTANPRVPGGLLQKGIVLWKLGRLDEAVKELEQAKEAEPRNVQIVVTLGAVEFEKGEYTNALSHLSNAILADNVPPDAFFYMARLKNAKNEHSQAIENMKRAIDYAGKNPVYHYWMGRILSDAKKSEDAVAEWKLAIQYDPRYADALEAMGGVYFDQNDLKKATELYKRVLDVDPKRTSARAAIGDAQMKLEDWGGAITSYTQAIEEDPTNKELLPAYYRLGQAYQEKNKIKEAVDAFRKTIEVD
ncbi:MAG: zinc-ribbon domain-containing protein, partial [Archangium sp.]|nr:zinc-ribbon domain-containing protein [Archangium sp.]